MTQLGLGTVLVTGGAGFIGRALAAELAPRAARWIAIDTLNPRIHATGTRPADLHPDAELIVADIRQRETWDDVLASVSPDVVVHLAAETDTGLSLGHVTRFGDVNVMGTAVMLDALAAHATKPRQLVVASSRAVYGEGAWRSTSDGHAFLPGQRTHDQLSAATWDFPDSEALPMRAGSTAVHPTSIYGATKYAQESMMSAWAGGAGVAFTALRLQNVYGPGQSLINPYTGILPLFIQAAARGESIDVYEDGRMRRDFVHIDDVARAFSAAILRGRTSAVLDVGSGTPVSVLDVAARIAHLLDAPPPTVSGRFRDGDVRHAWCAVDDIGAAIDWKPTIGWQDGISRYVAWYRDHH